MALSKIWHIGKEITIAIWEITESLEDLQQLQMGIFFLPDFKSTKRKKEFIISRLLSLKLLDTLTIEYLENGCPYLKDKPNVSIAISHTKNYVCFAYSEAHVIGIDIEVADSKPLKLLRRFCTAREINQIDNSLLKACLAWSAKEAMYKLNCVSLKNYAQQFSVDFAKFPQAVITSVEHHQKSNKYLTFDDVVLFVTFQPK